MKNCTMIMIALAILTAGLRGTLAPAATTIYQHNFEGDSPNTLYGTTVDVENDGPGVATWVLNGAAGDVLDSQRSRFRADGSLIVATPTNNSATRASSMLLPFTPSGGAIYTLSATLTHTVDAGNDWIALGFAGNDGGTGSTAKSFAHATVNGIGWLAIRSPTANVPDFTLLGPAATGASVELGMNGGSAEAKIILNTTAENWTAEYFINNVSKGVSMFSAAPTINFVGISAVGNGTLGKFDNFLLTATISQLLGDFDADGDVDGADFVVWQTNFPTSGGAMLSDGDATGEGNVDGADFAVWQDNFPSPSSATTVVPEPKAFLLIVIGGISAALAMSRRRRFVPLPCRREWKRSPSPNRSHGSK